MRELDDITDAIIDAAIHIHRDLGPGLLESVYEALLARALEKRGLHVERQTAVRFEYDGLVFDEGFRADLLVEHEVIVELKSVERLAPVWQPASDLSSAHDQTCGLLITSEATRTRRACAASSMISLPPRRRASA